MKGIVMEIKNRNAIVLTKEGSFERVPLHSGQEVAIGSEIIVPDRQKRSFFHTKQLSIVAVAVAAAVIFFFGSRMIPFNINQTVIAAYVNLDINPSLEIGVNDELDVVEVNPLNEDGKKLVEAYKDNITALTLPEFVNQTIELAKDQGYLNENKDILLTATAMNKKATKTVVANMEAIKEDVGKQGFVVTEFMTDKDTRNEAKNIGISPGKYAIYKQSQQISDITIEEAKELSVSEMYKKIDQDKQDKKKGEKVGNNSSQNKDSKQWNKNKKDQDKDKNSKNNDLSKIKKEKDKANKNNSMNRFIRPGQLKKENGKDVKSKSGLNINAETNLDPKTSKVNGQPKSANSDSKGNLKSKSAKSSKMEANSIQNKSSKSNSNFNSSSNIKTSVTSNQYQKSKIDSTTKNIKQTKADKKNKSNMKSQANKLSSKSAAEQKKNKAVGKASKQDKKEQNK